jgi:hypothetical protein
MRLRIFYGQHWLKSKWLPECLRAEAFVLYPLVVFEKAKGKVPRADLVHEMIHVRQIRRLGYIRFSLLYEWHYLLGLIRYRDDDKAYRSVPFEIEAYKKQRYVKLTKEERNEIRMGS